MLTGEFFMESSDVIEQGPQSCSGLAAKLKYDPRMETVWTILSISRTRSYAEIYEINFPP